MSQEDYQMLGVAMGTPEAEIRKAYHKLALQYHPDHNMNSPEAEDKLRDINVAYDNIMREKKETVDPELRPHFMVLGVSTIATEEEIDNVYRRLIGEYHPDHNRAPGADKKYAEILEAYRLIRGGDENNENSGEENW